MKRGISKVEFAGHITCAVFDTILAGLFLWEGVQDSKLAFTITGVVILLIAIGYLVVGIARRRKYYNDDPNDPGEDLSQNKVPIALFIAIVLSLAFGIILSFVFLPG